MIFFANTFHQTFIWLPRSGLSHVVCVAEIYRIADRSQRLLTVFPLFLFYTAFYGLFGPLFGSSVRRRIAFPTLILVRP